MQAGHEFLRGLGTAEIEIDRDDLPSIPLATAKTALRESGPWVGRRLRPARWRRLRPGLDLNGARRIISAVCDVLYVETRFSARSVFQ